MAWFQLGHSLLPSPKDFTPVCTTELGTVAKMKSEFDKRNVKVIAVSVDPIESHHGWLNDINETQNTKMNFPIIADPQRTVAGLYDMIHPNADEKHLPPYARSSSSGLIRRLKLTLTYSCFHRPQFPRIAPRD